MLVGFAQVDQRGQPLHDRVDIAGILAHHDDTVAGLVLGYRQPVSVVDLAACWGNQANADPVLLGQYAKLVGLFDLHIAHPQAKNTHEGKLRPAQNKTTSCNPACRFSAVLRVPSHIRCPSLSRSPGAALRTPKTSWVIMTTKG